MFGIGSVSVAPIRSEAEDTGEIVSQLLFGECIRVIKKDDQWIKVKTGWDDYEGWMDLKQIMEIPEQYYKQIIEQPQSIALSLVRSATSEHEHIPLVMGSTLPEYDGMSFKLFKKKMVYNGQAIQPPFKSNTELLVKLAKKYLYAPYLWGGRSPFGIDCSGLVQVVFKMLGKHMPRDAYQQAEKGKMIPMLSEARVGDVAFFANEKGRIIHTGILTGNEEIIHAHGYVRTDRIDHYGIYNDKEKKYSHKLRIIRRML